MSALFGTAGSPDDFKDKGYKNSVDMPEYLENVGLDTFEYQCGQGVRIGMQLAQSIGAKAAEKNIQISLHAPYFISLSSIEAEKRDNSIKYILTSAKAIDAMGGRRVILHSGSCGKISRQDALALAKDTLFRARLELCNSGLSHITLCPETMGKINQLGNLEEVVELCKVDESFVPCIDFGHLNARTNGGLNDSVDYEKILSAIENELGFEILNIFHSHFSKIEYTKNGGEVKHLTFQDQIYGPQFEPLMELIAKENISPTFICESDGTQGKDALAMREFYYNYKSKTGE